MLASMFMFNVFGSLWSHKFYLHMHSEQTLYDVEEL